MKIHFALPALALAGCTAITHVAPGERTVIQGVLAVEPSLDWSNVSTFSLYGAHVVVWTMDGPALDKLCFVAGLGDNESIHADRPGDPPEPRFRANMTPTEVMEHRPWPGSTGSTSEISTKRCRRWPTFWKPRRTPLLTDRRLGTRPPRWPTFHKEPHPQTACFLSWSRKDVQLVSVGS